jgi:hypothetical protein
VRQYSDWLRAGRARGRSPRPGRIKNYLFSTSSRPALGPTQPPIQLVPVPPEVKRPGCEAGHSSPTSAEVKKSWIYTSLLPTETHNRTLLFGITQPKHGRHFEHSNQSLNMRMRVCYLDCFIVRKILNTEKKA